MAEFHENNYMPMDRAYMSGNEISPEANVEEPLFPINKVGMTVTEGSRFGTLINTVQGAIRMGAGQIEIQTQMGGGAEAVGAESYGKDAREALRELAMANEVTLSSVHAPTQIGNLSGLSQQGFQEEQRHASVDEVKRAIKFAAETTRGGAIVVHTGEFQRPMFDASWNTKQGKWKGAFVAYDEEPERSTVPLVDQRTGKMMTEIRRNQIIHRPEWNRSGDDYDYGADDLDVERGNAKSEGERIHVSRNDYVDYEGKILDPEDRVAKWDKEKKEFVVRPYTWKDFQIEAEEMNQRLGLKSNDPNYITPEEAAIKAQIQGQIAIAKGYKLNYSRSTEDEINGLKELNQQLKYYQKIEKETPTDELWKLKRDTTTFLQKRQLGAPGMPPENKLPSEMIKESIDDLRRMIEQSREMTLGQEQQIQQSTEDMKNIVSVSKYARKSSIKSYVEAGLYAMDQTQNNPYAERDIFVAPENIFPEMGYGSHPQELIELVKNAREALAERLSHKYMEDESGRRILDSEEAKQINQKFGTKSKVGDIALIKNPHFLGISQEKAEDLAKRHIKATWDTQHQGMWWKHFKSKGNENDQQKRKRFMEWYMDQVHDMEKNEIIGNIHLVDSQGGGHHHLPIGQGDLPLKDALTYLKEHGYTGIINSEAHGEAAFGADRILVETWKQLGSPIYSHGSLGAGLTGPREWGDVHRSYFGRVYPPNFIFGAYAPSNEWTLWSEVPME